MSFGALGLEAPSPEFALARDFGAKRFRKFRVSWLGCFGDFEV